MHETKEASSPRKPDLRDTPPTSLSDNDIQSPVQDPQRETSNDPSALVPAQTSSSQE